MLMQNWDRLKATMDAANPNTPQPQARALPQSRASKRLRAVAPTDRVRQVFNAATSLSDVLGRNGYKAQGIDRWTAPTSTTGTPGVTLIPGGENDPARAYSYHAADTLNTGDPHDAFSVCAILEHAGDEGAARATFAATLQELEAKNAPDEIWVNDYGLRGGQLLRLHETRIGTVESPLTTFAALITSEIRRSDGVEDAELTFQITGSVPGGHKLTTVNVPASDFSSMGWVIKHWGSRAIIFAGARSMDYTRDAIMQLSNHLGVVNCTVYLHTGWTQHPEYGPLYLSAGVVIGPQGVIDNIKVELEGRLADYALPQIPRKEMLRGNVRASVNLLSLVPDEIGFSILGAAFRSVLGRRDFTVFPVGRTGTNKTTFLALVLSHFGSVWQHDHMPENWESTVNALERFAFLAKDVLLVIDDYKPSDAHDQVKSKLSRMVREQADGAGRSRVNRSGRGLHSSNFPRGTLMTSAETWPSGHSDQARTLLVNISAPLLGYRLPDGSREKSAAFYAAADLGRDGVYAGTMAGLIQYIAQHYSEVETSSPEHKMAVRSLARLFTGGHDRTPLICAELARGWQVFLTFAQTTGEISELEADTLWQRAVVALGVVARSQASYHNEVDPARRFMHLLHDLLSSGRAYLADAVSGGAPREHAEEVGWRYYGDEGPLSRDGKAERLGWIGQLPNGEMCLLLNPDITTSAIARLAEATGVSFPLTREPLGAALKDSGILGPVEKGKTTHKRAVHGAARRANVWHIKWQLFVADLETVGTETDFSSTETALLSVPLNTHLQGHAGTQREEDLPPTLF
ncbi:DUF927 domain-containing protein [Deinococcus sp. AJ005]|uniref:DUF927 domain-containing protein n=1 Tax=Deinococcus sp. AJ005 TaxID=2652443 RepID=UPI00125CC933|nr:DUF927 domain-containing protein [Deinococcus sp. AJ005]QFP75408.1 DUF927 domain-containing protein [Deinococcus sp. AJ005]